MHACSNLHQSMQSCQDCTAGCAWRNFIPGSIGCFQGDLPSAQGPLVKPSVQQVLAASCVFP